MKHLIILLIVLFHLSVSGQPGNSSPNRKQEIAQCIKPVFSAKEFRHIADSLRLRVDELSDYPVIFPVKKPQRVSSGFGMRKHPVYKVQKFHSGIDLAERKGTPVYATGNGIVIRKGYDSGYGNFVEIEHAGGFRSFYAHLSKTLVHKGDSVCVAGQIAYIGNTGVATGSHLHYEIRKGRRFLNPMQWCLLSSSIN